MSVSPSRAPSILSSHEFEFKNAFSSLELNQILDEMDSTMAQYVDAEFIDERNKLTSIDLTLERTRSRLEPLDAPSILKDILAFLVDKARLLIAGAVIIVTGVAIALTAQFLIPLLGVMLFIISTVVVILGLCGLGLWWLECGDSAQLQRRLHLISELRNLDAIPLESSWALRKNAQNRWSFRNELSEVIIQFVHQSRVDIREYPALINNLRFGSWSDIDKTLLYLVLRMQFKHSLCEDSQKYLSRVEQELGVRLERSLSTGCELTSFLDAQDSIERMYDKVVIGKWIDEAQNPSFEPLKDLLKNGHCQEFKTSFFEIISHSEDSSITTETLLNRSQELLEADGLHDLANRLDSFRRQKLWYAPIDNLMPLIQSGCELDAAEVKRKVDAFGQGYLAFLMERLQLGLENIQESRKYFEYFTNKWWNNTLFELIQTAAQEHKKDNCSLELTKSSEVICDFAVDKQQKLPTPIIVFMSNGGGGHRSAAAGTRAVLEKYSESSQTLRDYQVEFVNAPRDVFGDVDLIEKFCTFFGIRGAEGGIKNGEDLYNDLLNCGWYSAANFFIKVGTSHYVKEHVRLKGLLFDYLNKRVAEGKPLPSLMISNMPVINPVVEEVCHALSIPFLLTTTDLKTNHYLNGLSFPEQSTEMFKYTLAYPDFLLYENIVDGNLKPQHLLVTGFPVKPEFMEKTPRTPENRARIISELSQPALSSAINEDAIIIPADKLVIAISMGAQGSELIYKYLDQVVQVNRSLHVIILCGRNQAYLSEVKRKYASHLISDENEPQISFTPVGFTSRVAMILDIANLFIGKPGPNSMLEAMYKGVPVLLDNTSPLIDNEKDNIGFAVRHGFGEGVNEIEQLPELIEKYLSDTEEFREADLAVFKDRSSLLRDKNFSKVLPGIIERMLLSAEKEAVDEFLELAFINFSTEILEDFLSIFKVDYDVITAYLQQCLIDKFPETSETDWQTFFASFKDQFFDNYPFLAQNHSRSIKETVLTCIRKTYADKSPEEIRVIYNGFWVDSSLLSLQEELLPLLNIRGPVLETLSALILIELQRLRVQHLIRRAGELQE